MVSALAPIGRQDDELQKNNVTVVPNDRTALFIGQKGAKQGALEQKPLHSVLTMKKGTPEQARQKTGWFQNPYDNKWRFEIDDSKSIFKNRWEELVGGKLFDLEGKEKGKYKLSDVFEHPELFNYYPELRDITIEKKPFLGLGVRGSFNPSSSTIRINPSLNSEQAKGTLLHELQHWIQYREDFAKGGNANTVKLTAVIPKLQLFFARKLSEAKTSKDKYSEKEAISNIGLLNSLNAKKPAIEKGIAEIEGLKAERIKFDVETDRMREDLQKLMDDEFNKWRRINDKYATLRGNIDTKTLPAGKLISTIDSINAKQEGEIKGIKENIDRYQRQLLDSYNRKNPFEAKIKTRQDGLNKILKPFAPLQYMTYRLLAGEQEARLSDERANMALPERRETPPYADAIKPGEAILR